LGPLKRASGHIPHPAGTIDVELERVGADSIGGTVTLPAGLSGIFVWKGEQHPLSPGRNQLHY
jgi:hypothetical protein